MAAIGEQAAAFYDAVLPPLLREVVSTQQQRVSARSCCPRELVLAAGMEAGELVLDPPQESASAVTEANAVELHVAAPHARLSGRRAHHWDSCPDGGEGCGE